MKKHRKRVYTISNVAAAYDIHPQTLRLYEKHGLLKPSRSRGNTRLYSERDLHRLELILNLTRELGVNLAGVEIILNMRAKMEKMQQEVREFMQVIGSELAEHSSAFRFQSGKRPGANGAVQNHTPGQEIAQWKPCLNARNAAAAVGRGWIRPDSGVWLVVPAASRAGCSS